MKRVLLLAVVMLCAVPLVMGGDKDKKVKKTVAPKTAAPKADDDAEIHWISLEEAQAKMKTDPRKVYIDVYTSWCGWCKRLEATTFRNPALVKYINRNFYAVRLDAETQQDINFMGKVYHFEPKYKANMLAVELLHGQMSYPTGVIMLEDFQNATPIPGYHPVNEMEPILTYFGDNAFRHQKWDDYQKSYAATWDKVPTPAPTSQAVELPVHSN